MPTYTTPQLRNNLRVALDQAKSGQTVLITRHDETFRLVLEKSVNSPKPDLPTITINSMGQNIDIIDPEYIKRFAKK